jgi:WD40 repeat protein
MFRARSRWRLLWPAFCLAALGAEWRPPDRPAEVLPPGAVARLGDRPLWHKEPIHALAYLPDGKRLLSVVGDGIICLWDLATHREIRRFPQEARVADLAVCADGKRLVAALLQGSDSYLLMWELETGNVLRRIDRHREPCNSLGVSRDGRLAAVQSGKVIELWDLSQGKRLRLMGPLAMPSYLAFTHDGKTLVSIGTDGVEWKDLLSLWDVATGECRSQEKVQAAGLLADGRTLVRVKGNRVTWRDVLRDEEPQARWVRTELYRGMTGLGGSALFRGSFARGSGLVSPEGTLLLTEDPVPSLWDLNTGQLVRQLPVEFSRQHLSQVRAFSPDGSSLALLGPGGLIEIVPTRRERELALLPGHTERVQALAYSPDGRWLASCSADGIVRTWDLATRQPVPSLAGHRGEVLAVAFARDRTNPSRPPLLVSGGEDGIVIVWDGDTGREVRRLRPLFGPILSLAFTADIRGLIIGQARWIQYHDLATGQERYRIAHSGRYLALSADGKTLTAGGQPLAGVQWEVATGKPLARPEAIQSRLTAVAFAPDGRHLAYSTEEGGIFLQDPSPGASRFLWSFQVKGFTHLAFTPDGRQLVAGRRSDYKIEVSELASGKPHSQILAPVDVAAFALAPDGKTVAVAGEDGYLALWALPERFPEGVRNGHRGPVLAVTFSPDGRTVATAGQDGVIRLWEAGGGRLLRVFPRVEGGIRELRFSPDGKHLAWCGTFSGVCLWSLAEDRLSWEWKGERGRSELLAFAPNGQSLAVSGGGVVWAREVDTGRILWSSLAGDGGARALAFAPDGQWLATAMGQGAVALWDACRGKEIRRLKTERIWPPMTLAVSPDGKQVAVAGGSTEISLLDPNTGKELRRLGEHPWHINAVVYSPDGRTLVTAGADGIVRLWDPSSGRLRRQLDGHRGEVFCLAFSPDGRTLVSGSEDSTVMLWDMTGGQRQRP